MKTAGTMTAPGTEAEAAQTHPDVKTLEAVARRGSQGHHLRASVSDRDLEVAVGVLLLEDDADGLFDVDEEAARRGALLVVRHAAGALVVSKLCSLTLYHLTALPAHAAGFDRVNGAAKGGGRSGGVDGLSLSK